MSPTTTSVVVHAWNHKATLHGIGRIIAKPHLVAERLHEVKHVFFRSPEVTAQMSCISFSYTRRNPGCGNFSKLLPLLHLLTVSHRLIDIVLQLTPVSPSAQHHRICLLHKILVGIQHLCELLWSSTTAEMIEYWTSFDDRSGFSSKHVICQILEALLHILGLICTCLYIWINFCNPIIVQPSVAPVHTYLETIFGSNRLHGLEQIVVLVRHESPLDKEAVDTGGFGTQYLIFDEIWIQVGLHTYHRIVLGCNLMTAIISYIVSIAADVLDVCTRFRHSGKHSPFAYLTIMLTCISHTMIIGVNLLTITGIGCR